MHLPEAPSRDDVLALPVPVAGQLTDEATAATAPTLGRGQWHEHRLVGVHGVDDVDRLDVGPLGVEHAGVDDGPRGDEAVLDGHDLARPMAAQSGAPGSVDGELDPAA